MANTARAYLAMSAIKRFECRTNRLLSSVLSGTPAGQERQNFDSSLTFQTDDDSIKRTDRIGNKDKETYI